MTRDTIPIMLWLCLVLALPRLAAADGRDRIAWDPERSLAWSDFGGSVARGAEPVQVAMTAASLGWTYEYEVELSGSDCRYRITGIRSSAVFDTHRSWVRPGHRTAAVLAHEQGHFDITEIHRRKFEEASRALVGAPGSCSGRNARRASDHVEKDIARRVGPIYDAVWRDLGRVQSAYDAETGHGTHAAAQQRWLAAIAEALGGLGWAALDPLAAVR